MYKTKKKAPHPSDPYAIMAVTVLVTGGCGFLGSAIVAALAAKHPKWEIAVLDIQAAKKAHPGVRYQIGDVTEYEGLNRIVGNVKPNVIIHAAGFVPRLVNRYGRKDHDECVRVNVLGTQNILAAAIKSGVDALVWTGSFAGVTDDLKNQFPNMDESWPTSCGSLLAYGESKTTAETLVLLASNQLMATCSLRPSVIFGPGDTLFIPSLHACIGKGETPFIVGDGVNLWDITYITNVADAHVLAAENLLSSKTAAGQAIFISNGEPVPFRDFCRAVWYQFGHDPPFEAHIPRKMAFWAGCIAELVGWLTRRPTTLSRGSVLDACSVRYCNLVKARTVLGYMPRLGIEEGIRISCEVSGDRRMIMA